MATYASRHPKLSILAAVIVALLILLAIFDWNWLRGPVERMASAKTERPVSLGHFDVKLSWPPVIQLRDVHIGNIQGASPPQMIAADEIDVAVDVRSLFGHDIVIPHVRLEKPDVHLQRLADGSTNWTFGKPGKPSEGSVKVLGLAVDHGNIEYADRMLDIDVSVQAATGPSQLNDSPLHRSLTTQLAFKGHYGKTPFDGTASTGDVLSLQETGKPFALLTKFTLNKTRISADGSVTDLLKPSAIDAQLSVAGPDLALLYPALPVALPNSPPYRFAGRFVMHDKTYAYNGFKGVIGKSDIAGDASFTPRTPRPFLEAKLRSNYLSLEDLGPLIGTGPRPGSIPKNADGTPEVSPRADAVMKAGTGRVLPQKAFKLDKLNAMDTALTLDVKKLNVPDELPLEDLHASLKVDAGKLQLSPLKLGVASGSIVAYVTLDGRQDPIAIDATIDVSHARLAELFPTVKAMRTSAGAVGAKVHLIGRGNSIATLLATSNGTAQFAMSGGTVSNLMMEAVGLDGGEIIKYLVRGDEQTPIRCAGAAFKVSEGVATSNVIVFDTGDTRVDGDGYVDMKNEQFDVLLKPEPKDRSILALRVPVRLHGSFAKPGYSLKAGELALRGGAAIALGLVNPLLALVPLIETGPGTNTDCAAVFRATASAVKDDKTK
ncbi:MAG: AsmA [Rhodocyclales bacterium]|nr:AsmA [Rhodocyclales bacterium]